MNAKKFSLGFNDIINVLPRNFEEKSRFHCRHRVIPFVMQPHEIIAKALLTFLRIFSHYILIKE